MLTYDTTIIIKDRIFNQNNIIYGLLIFFYKVHFKYYFWQWRSTAVNHIFFFLNQIRHKILSLVSFVFVQYEFLQKSKIKEILLEHSVQISRMGREMEFVVLSKTMYCLTTWVKPQSKVGKELLMLLQPEAFWNNSFFFPFSKQS